MVLRAKYYVKRNNGCFPRPFGDKTTRKDEAPGLMGNCWAKDRA
jgi:hypothetical protein